MTSLCSKRHPNFVGIDDGFGDVDRCEENEEVPKMITLMFIKLVM